jgi:ribulose-5-phosphate 4-epimerase/fuculose-1-phosphate aldolase
MASDVNNTPTEAELREQVATCCRILYKLGLADYLGHPSARVPGTDRIVVKPRHSVKVKGMDTMTAADMVIVDMQGKMIEGENIPVNEIPIHTRIYCARPDVLSVVHTHQPMATFMGVMSAPILPLLHLEAPLVARPVPIFPCAKLILDDDLGDALAQSLADHTVCHMQGHGIVSVGQTVPEATLGAIFLERLATVNYQAALLAPAGLKPRVIPPDEVEAMRRELQPPVGRWAYYSDMVRVPGA